MFRTVFVTIFLITTLFLFSHHCLAATPNISAVSGNLHHKGMITIGGSNFGSKSTAAPLRYDNFESGVDGDPIPDNPATGWDVQLGEPTYSTEQVRNPGGQSMLTDFSNSYAEKIRLSNTEMPGSIPNTNEIYISGWFWFHAWGMPTRNMKIITTGVGSNVGLWQTRWDWGATSSGTNSTINGDNTTADCNAGSGDVKFGVNKAIATGDDGKWHRLEYYLRVGSDGEIAASVDGYGDSATGAMMNDSCAAINYINFAAYFSRDIAKLPYTRGDDVSCSTYVTGAVTQWTLESDSTAYNNKYYTCEADGTWDDGVVARPTNLASAKRFWDELYVDITQARVEIGDAPVWQDCIHKEIQTPTAWSATSITVNANFGSFQAGKQLYLYVVDANGNVNTEGYAINAAFSSFFPIIKSIKLEG